MDWRDNTKLHEQHTMSMAADENLKKKNKNSVWIDYLDCEMKKKEIISKIRVVNSMLRSNFSPSNLEAKKSRYIINGNGIWPCIDMYEITRYIIIIIINEEQDGKKEKKNKMMIVVMSCYDDDDDEVEKILQIKNGERKKNLIK